MMRPLSTLLLLAMVCASHADTVLLEEGFEGTVGGVVAGWNGWTGDPGVVVSNIVIDQGNSAAWAGVDEWPVVSKSFFHTPDDAEQYVLTATLSAPDAKGAYADVRLATAAAKNAKHVGAQLGYRDLYFQQDNACDGTAIRISQSAATMDVKLIVTDGRIDCFYRNHGATDWLHAGTLKATNPMKSYNSVSVAGGIAAGRSPGGNIDSIRLVAIPNKR
jgi:hypothetical protein